jgi:mono/diheme cytochrome c family protein
MKLRTAFLTVAIAATACATTYDPLEDYVEMPAPKIMAAPSLRTGATDAPNPELAARGRYLVELIGCATCHTDGALIGDPDFDRWLAGSRVGIAYSNPLKHKNPGVLYPSNLTSDNETGIGSWTDAEIESAIRGGVDQHGRRQVAVMPWPAYAKLSDEDLDAIVAYLQSLAPIRHAVPSNVAPGDKASEQYVHFGVYRSRR